MTLDSHYPVVIVGAGPTGLTLANLLGRHGTHFLLVERNASTVQEPRAVSIDDESLRTIQAAGLIEIVLRDVVAGYGSIYYTAQRIRFAKVQPTGTPYGYARRNAFRQPRLEAQLCAALGHVTGATVLFGWRLQSFRQTTSHVELRLVHADGGTKDVSCDYLVGCDGANSAVRATLGVELDGMTYSMRWLILDLENNENRTKHTEVFCSRRRPCITLPGPDGTRRYEFELFPNETDAEMLAPERVNALLRSHGADPRAVIRRKAVYRFHARVAQRWLVRRVLLAGDAAHLTPPFAGQGMNSGIRDAHNLAWKLAAVAARTAGAGLLQTYEQERYPHVRQMIDLALRMGRVMSPPNRCSALLTQTGFLLLNLWPPGRDYMTQMKYKPSPRFSSGFMVPDGRSIRRTLVGRLLQQPKVVTVGGRLELLDDTIGARFALLVRTSMPEAAFACLNQPIWDALGALRIALLPRGAAPLTLEGGVTVAESDDSFSEGLGPCRTEVILLRPDRYVVACFPAEKAADAALEVQGLLARTWLHTPVAAPAGPRRGAW